MARFVEVEAWRHEEWGAILLNVDRIEDVVPMSGDVGGFPAVCVTFAGDDGARWHVLKLTWREAMCAFGAVPK